MGDPALKTTTIKTKKTKHKKMFHLTNLRVTESWAYSLWDLGKALPLGHECYQLHRVWSHSVD